MESRLKLQTLLEGLLGSREVYFNPPESVKMASRAIVYSRARPEVLHANNSFYKRFDAYQLIVIHDDPDDPIVDAISRLPMCTWERHYNANNLGHDVFTIYHN